MECRTGCGACCIAPSISSALPGMPFGKPAGIPCVHLLDDYRCELFGLPSRPLVCSSLKPQRDMCGIHRDEAMVLLEQLQIATEPDP